MADYRVPRARAHRLQAESLRCEAESDRLYGFPCAQYAADKLALADSYDLMAASLEADIASSRRAAGQLVEA